MQHYPTITAIVIEKHRLFREGIKQIIESEPLFRVIGEGDDKKDTFRLVNRYKPNILILDEDIFIEDLEKGINEISSISPNTKIILLSARSANTDTLILILGSGAHGYIVKEMNDEMFIKAIKTVYRGRFWLHPDISHSLVREYQRLRNALEQSVAQQRQRRPKLPLHLFTLRECEVLELLVTGKTNQDIAKFLNITESTVKNHMRNILGKMNVQDRTNAVILAIKNNWVEPKNRSEIYVNRAELVNENRV